MEILKPYIGAQYVLVKHWQALLTSGLLPIVLLVGVGFIEADALALNQMLLLGSTVFLAQALLMCVTHRLIVLGPNRLRPWYGLVGLRELRFVSIHFLLLAVCLLPVLILGAIPVIGLPLGLTVGGFLFARFSIILPAIATDQPMHLHEAWRLSKSHYIVLIAITLVIPLLLAALLLSASLVLSDSSVTQFILRLLSVPVIVVQTSFLSVVFLEVQKNNRNNG